MATIELLATPRKVATQATANAALVPGRHTPVSANGGARTMTLPTGRREGTVISVEKTDSTGNTVTITGNMRGAASQSFVLTAQFQTIEFLADAAGSWWPQGGSAPSAAVDLSKVDAVIFYNTGTNAYPNRSTATSDAARRVRWVGPTAPVIGGNGAVTGLDVWEKTA